MPSPALDTGSPSHWNGKKGPYISLDTVCSNLFSSDQQLLLVSTGYLFFMSTRIVKTTVAALRPPPWVNITCPLCRNCAGPPARSKVNQLFTALSTHAVFFQGVPVLQRQTGGQRANDYQKEELLSTALLFLVFKLGATLTYDSTSSGARLGAFISLFTSKVQKPFHPRTTSAP